MSNARKILIIDDDDELRESLSEQLSLHEEFETVLAATAMEADALDTALMVMGAESGFQWCVEHNAAALLLAVGQSPGELKERATPRFQELVGHASVNQQLPQDQPDRSF